MSNFSQRLLLGCLCTIVVLALILTAHSSPWQYAYLAAVVFVQGLALWEYYRLAATKGIAPLVWIGVVAGSAWVVSRFVQINGVGLAVLWLFVVVSFCAHFLRRERAIADLATTVFGLAYVTLPISLMIDLNSTTPVWMLLLLVATKATDTCAYFAGHALGQRQLAPVLSPKKSVEGAIGGVVGAMVVCSLFAPAINASWPEALLLGLLIGIAAILGDLAESLLKRDAHQKDSNVLPGFGGVLDMVDSLLFTTPLLYLYFAIKTQTPILL